MVDPEKEKEILEVLKAVSEQYGSAPSEGSLRAYVKILARYHHPNLFRLLWKIPELYGEFPTKSAIEAAARQSLGMEPSKGISEELIEKNLEAMLKDGVPADKAEAGANFLKKVLGIGDIPPARQEEKSDDLLFGLSMEF